MKNSQGNGTARLYNYVGPRAILDRLGTAPEGVVVRSQECLYAWLEEKAIDGSVVATFVIDRSLWLCLSERESEHVHCAGGEAVFAAGEIWFEKLAEVWEVDAISNQSTGYCPSPDCWPVVAEALDGLGLCHPGHFTTSVLFSRCSGCGQINLIKDEWYYCAICSHSLSV